MVTGTLTALQLSASPTRSQQVDSFAQVLLLDEFMLLTCDTYNSTEALYGHCWTQDVLVLEELTILGVKLLEVFSREKKKRVKM